jgi:hypothetical protein
MLNASRRLISMLSDHLRRSKCVRVEIVHKDEETCVSRLIDRMVCILFKDLRHPYCRQVIVSSRPPAAAEVKNTWNCTSTPQYVLISWYLIKH